MFRSENELIKQHMGLVEAIVQKFQPPQSDIDDYRQQGYIGLLYAIRHHNPKKGKLSTIATKSIEWEILKYINKQQKYYNHNINNMSLLDNVENITKNKINIFNYALSNIEAIVLNMRNTGMTFKEISIRISMPISLVYKLYCESIQKIKTDNV